MSITSRFLDELRARVLLSDVIGKRVKVTRAGREYKACCPFHHEKSPSFTINDDKMFYHCFGCGAHGDIVGFVMQHDNLSFPEAVEQLATMAGMQMPEQTPQDLRKAKEEKSLYDLVEEATKFFINQLHDPKHKVQLQYIRDRGVSENLLQTFRLGFAPADGQLLFKYLKDKGFTKEQCVDAGLVKESTRGGEPYAFFRDRIMFPVADRRGRVVAFGGRIMPDHLRAPDKGDFKPPKYINSPDTPLFHKGRMLFGESHARQAAVDDDRVVVVEGYMDVMACFSVGYRGAVAPLGTALTDDQITALWKMIPSRQKIPLLCFDGDNAGRRAAKRAAENILPLLKPDHSAAIVFLPEGEDPDSLVKVSGRKGLEAVFENAMPLVDFVWTSQLEGLDLTIPEARAGLEKALDDMVARIADRTVQQYYRQALKDKIYQEFARKPSSDKSYAPRQEWRGGKKVPAGPQVILKRPTAARKDTASITHAIMLATVINHPSIFEDIEDELALINMLNNKLDSLRKDVLHLLGSSIARGESLDGLDITHHLKDKGYENELSFILSESVYVHAAFARPQADSQKALSGWRDMQSFLERQAIQQELKAAGAALAQEASAENEERLRQLLESAKEQRE
jgi:DNA primase